jgi:hypothetical protein
MELQDDLTKKLECMNMEIWRSKTYGGGQKKLGKSQGQGVGGDIRTGRQQQKLSSEELLYNALRKIRAGTYSHCKKENRFCREYLDSGWRKRQDSKEERFKGAQTNN